MVIKTKEKSTTAVLMKFMRWSVKYTRGKYKSNQRHFKRT